MGMLMHRHFVTVEKREEMPKKEVPVKQEEKPVAKRVKKTK